MADSSLFMKANDKKREIAGKLSWTAGLDKSKYSPETIARWKADEHKAGKQFAQLQKNPHKDLPSTAPARMAYDDRHKN